MHKFRLFLKKDDGPLEDRIIIQEFEMDSFDVAYDNAKELRKGSFPEYRIAMLAELP